MKYNKSYVGFIYLISILFIFTNCKKNTVNNENSISQNKEPLFLNFYPKMNDEKFLSSLIKLNNNKTLFNNKFIINSNGKELKFDINNNPDNIELYHKEEQNYTNKSFDDKNPKYNENQYKKTIIELKNIFEKKYHNTIDLEDVFNTQKNINPNNFYLYEFFLNEEIHLENQNSFFIYKTKNKTILFCYSIKGKGLYNSGKNVFEITTTNELENNNLDLDISNTLESNIFNVSEHIPDFSLEIRFRYYRNNDFENLIKEIEKKIIKDQEKEVLENKNQNSSKKRIKENINKL